MTISPNSYKAELLPCPMCGKEAAIGKTTLRRQDAAGEYREYTGYSVNCIWCGVNNRSIAEGYATPELAAEHWNKRSNGPSVPSEKGQNAAPAGETAAACSRQAGAPDDIQEKQ